MLPNFSLFLIFCFEDLLQMIGRWFYRLDSFLFFSSKARIYSDSHAATSMITWLPIVWGFNSLLLSSPFEFLQVIFKIFPVLSCKNRWSARSSTFLVFRVLCKAYCTPFLLFLYRQFFSPQAFFVLNSSPAHIKVSFDSTYSGGFHLFLFVIELLPFQYQIKRKTRGLYGLEKSRNENR